MVETAFDIMSVERGISRGRLTGRQSGRRRPRGGRWASLAAILGLSACAVAPPAQQEPLVANYDASAAPETVKEVVVQPQPVNEDSLVCRDEVRVGSHWTRRRCFRRGDLERARQNAQEWLRTGGNSGSPTVVR